MSVAGNPVQNRWNDKVPADRAWKGRQGRSRAAVTSEQDRAAGGRYRRSVDLGDGRFACASVVLRLLPNTRRVRAYLRWGDGRRSPERYLGEVDHGTRAANLAEGWHRAAAKGLLSEEPLPEGSKASSMAVRDSMRGNRGKDTKPEKRLRSLLHKHGLRYRVDAAPLIGLRRRADVVFTRAKVAVFMDGCFWHACPEHYRPSTKNAERWKQKIEGNRLRDTETVCLLEAAGWTVIRAWEHEDPARVARRVIVAVRGPQDDEVGG